MLGHTKLLVITFPKKTHTTMPRTLLLIFAFSMIAFSAFAQKPKLQPTTNTMPADKPRVSTTQAPGARTSPGNAQPAASNTEPNGSTITPQNLPDIYVTADTSTEKKVKVKYQKTNLTEMADSIYKARIKLETIDGVYIPRDLYDCFKQLDKLMDADVKAKFMAFKDTEVDARAHKSVGFWLQNKWSLTEGSRLSKYFNDMGVPHYDYMVSIVLTTYHRYLHKKDLGVKALVKQYKKHWKDKRAKEKAAAKSGK